MTKHKSNGEWDVSPSIPHSLPHINIAEKMFWACDVFLVASMAVFVHHIVASVSHLPLDVAHYFYIVINHSTCYIQVLQLDAVWARGLCGHIWHNQIRYKAGHILHYPYCLVHTSGPVPHLLINVPYQFLKVWFVWIYCVLYRYTSMKYFWVDRNRPEKPTEPLVWTAKISCNLCLSGGHGKGYLDTTFSSKWCALSKVCACWNVIMYGFINCMCPCSVSIGYVDSAYADKT